MPVHACVPLFRLGQAEHESTAGEPGVVSLILLLALNCAIGDQLAYLIFSVRERECGRVSVKI